MVKLEYLDPYEVFKVTPPMIMPEGETPKKGNAYMVLAPSAETELNYLATESSIRFRNLTRYYIDKRWDYTFYKAGRKIVKPDDDNEITQLIERYGKRGQLKTVDTVSSFLTTSNAKPLKELNVLIEVNHMYDMIMTNEKDKRYISVKSIEFTKELIAHCNTYVGDNGVLGKYNNKINILIPMHLWFTTDDYRNPLPMFKRISDKPMAHILGTLSENLLKEDKINLILVHDRVVMIMNKQSLPSEATSETIMDAIFAFMKKAKNANDIIDTPDDKSKEKEASVPAKVELDPETDSYVTTPVKKKPAPVAKSTPEENAKKVEEAQIKTKVDLTTEKILKDDKVDTSTPEYKAKKEAVKKTVEKTMIETNPTPAQTNEPDVVADNDFPEVDNIVANTNVGNTELDVVTAAKLAGKSVKSYQRDEMLKNKYKDLKIGSSNLSEVIAQDEVYEIPEVTVTANTVNENLKSIKAHNFEESYNKNLMQKDIASILLHFGHVKPALYLNKDIQIEDVSTSTDRLYKYTVEYEDENRKRHRFSFLMPKMYKEKYLFINGKQLDITHQKLPFPVTKIGTDRCQVVSNYNKIISQRYGANISPRITKIKKVFCGPDCPGAFKVVKGDSTRLNKMYMTTVEFDDLATNMTRFQMGKGNHILTIYFIIDDSRATVPPMKTQLKNEDGTDVPMEHVFSFAIEKNGKDTPIYYYLNGENNIVISSTGEQFGELSEFIVAKASEFDSKIADEFADTTAGSKFVYSRSKIMDENIPMILVLAAADPSGIMGVLDKAQIPYEFTDKRPTVDKDEKAVVPFQDGWLVYSRYPFENSLLMNGLSAFPTKEFNFYDLNQRDTFVEIFDLLFGRRALIDGIENFYYMMIDPITMDVLMKLNLPTDFTRVMLYCNGMLADNAYHIDSDYNDSRIRSNEIICSFLYKHLADAWGAWKDGRAEKFSIREDAVIKSLVTCHIVDPHTTLNVSLEVENDRQVKLKGPNGMNEERSFTAEKRAYHPSMRGIVGMNSTPSGEVGINRHLTTNANIDDARGFVTIEKDEYDGTELLTPAEMLQTFGPESADIERVAMSISQSKHLVPVASQCSAPITYDMERVIPYLSNDFSFVAKQKGKVVEISNDLMIIQYADGSYHDIDLSEHPVKNTDGGFFIMNQMSTDYKVGQTFKEGDVIAYDKKYINNNDFFGDPCANVGTLARVAIETNGQVYEDACYITDKLAHRLATKITMEKRVILSKYSNIKYMAKVGQTVKANEPILTFDDTEDEFASQMLASIAAEMDDEEEIIATNAPVVSKVTGVIKDINIIYTVPIEEMTSSLAKIVKDYVGEAKKREKTLSKYMAVNDANTIVKASEMQQVDYDGKVAGIKVGEGVVITFKIEYEDVMSVGDKLTNLNVGFIDYQIDGDEFYAVNYLEKSGCLKPDTLSY